MIVVDASAFAELILGGGRAPLDRDFHAPSVCDLELASTVRRLLRSRRLTLEGAATAIAEYLSMPLTRYQHTALLGRVLELRDNFTAYDASYVALAEWLEAPLLTADRRLARAVRRHVPHVALA